jgi:thioredoxin 1
LTPLGAITKFPRTAVASAVGALEQEKEPPMAGDKVIPVNDLNFDAEVLQSEIPVLIDFTATWCQPCRAIAPLVNQLAGEYDGRVKVTSLDIDESPGVAQRYQIRGVPTLLVIKGGQVVGQQVGAVPKTKIAALMDQAL